MAPKSNDRADENYEKPKLRDDIWNFGLLTFLYVLQCSVGGLAGAIPTILQKRNITYEDQGGFNFVWYPFTFKMFWAPIVDSIYIKKIGRRKSWFVLTQYITGVLLFLLSMNINDWLGTEDGKQQPNVRMLALTFFLCILSISIQDIAVDAWSLTMLQKKNVAYAAIAQSIGFSFGYYVVSAAFIMLESKDFGNKFRMVPQNHGLVSFSEFSFFLSMMVLITSTLILIFKKEKIRRDDCPKVDDNESKLSIGGTYTLLWKMLKMQPVLILSLILITRQIGPAPVQNVGPLKLLDNGIKRDTLATFSLMMFPIQLCTPFILSRYIIGRRPLRTFLILYILRLINSGVYASFIYVISYWKNKYNILPTWYYWPLMLTYNFQSAIVYITMMTFIATFTRISDPRYGGVYMTFFNSMNNLGEFWPSSLTLWSVNFLNIRSCSWVNETGEESCYILIDGFYIQTIVFTIFGVLWIFWAKKVINYIEQKDADAFRVRQNPAHHEVMLFEERLEPLINKR